MKLREVLILTILNIVGFVGLKQWNDTRVVRIVTALSPSVVKVYPLGQRWFDEIALTPKGFVVRRVNKGFGILGHGSGVFVRKDGLIVTCAHVVEGTALAEIALNEEKDLVYQKRYSSKGKILAYVVGRDRVHDVALLRPIEPLTGIKPVRVGTSVEKGLTVFTIGYPGPMKKYVTAGIVSGERGGDIFSDICIAPGNSGGGVFNLNGELVGLAKAMTGPQPYPLYQGFSIFTPLDAIIAILEKY